MNEGNKGTVMVRRALQTLGFVLSLWVLSAAAAFAQAPEKKPPPGFEPVAGAPDTAKVDPNPLVVGAYAAFFVGMFGFLVYVVKRQSDMSKEMAELAERINRAEQK